MNVLTLVIEATVVVLLFAGIAQFRTPPGAWRGNLFSMVAFGLAVAFVLVSQGSRHPVLVAATIVVGGVVGYLVAARVNMLQIPSMVAFQHGCGGIAAFLLSFVELTRGVQTATPLERTSALLGLVIGAATATGSLIAAAKLSARMRGTPIVLRGHGFVLLGSTIVLVALFVPALVNSAAAVMVALATALVVVALAIGVLVSIRIGGADMPVLVSFLNASAGLAAAFAGVALGNRLLVVCGATVAASGSILTAVMCRAMNRSMLRIFTGIQTKSSMPVPATAAAVPAAPLGAEPGVVPAGVSQVPPAGAPAVEPEPAPVVEVVRTPLDDAVAALAEAKSVVIVPGYGMALAGAQFAAVDLANRLAHRGAQVDFAIHPVAGRMPGHMNVLLAEADLSYDLLVEMDQINPRFPQVDVAVVIGACDVVNPAAQNVPDTPISGMPILNVDQARQVIVCNLDDKPGYSGVPNSLYDQPETLMLLGDAKTTVETLNTALTNYDTTPATAAATAGSNAAVVQSPLEQAVAALAGAKNVVIVPGYGMALAGAQFAAVDLANRLAHRGTQVDFAIHPVAGRMPGHMNVLLAEADLSYDLLVEMDQINPRFPDVDVAVVIGACDVVNPAAQNVPDTPISGMPILNVDQARHVIVCNLDDKPGYSGVPNSLYDQPETLMLLGDAKTTVETLNTALTNYDTTPATAAATAGSNAAVVQSPLEQAVAALAEAKSVVIVPGYGMALAGAQFAAVDLANRLAQRGTEVDFAIHPVAGRMPGHMNVLLAEADLSYDLLVEMDQINPHFPQVDVAVVIGACDVVNPAAQNVPDTPISGMPILTVDQARQVIVCNLDDKPGYSGVPNSLYDQPETLMLLGDAKTTVEELATAVNAT